MIKNQVDIYPFLKILKKYANEKLTHLKSFCINSIISFQIKSVKVHFTNEIFLIIGVKIFNKNFAVFVFKSKLDITISFSFGKIGWLVRYGEINWIMC